MFVIGETFQTFFGAFDYVIQRANERIYFDPPAYFDHPAFWYMRDSILAFPYMNYDLSTCDVLSITLAIDFNSSQGSAYSTADVR
jgi:hypothetical protein